MLPILSTNLCHQSTTFQNIQNPAILYLKSLNRPCCPMARPECRETGLDEGDINPKEKSLIDQAIEKISTKNSKELLCDDSPFHFQNEKICAALDQAKLYIFVLRTECKKCVRDLALHVPRQECLLAETAGTITGWVSGIIVVKVGKVAAFGLGGGILLLHLASECGYIHVNWERVRAACARSPDWAERIIRFVKGNTCYSVGFVGGFFFGVASS